jgi:Xaa-Pro aminopeptidase
VISLDDPAFAALLAPVDHDRMRRDRQARLFEMMDRHGVDAVIAFEYANGRYIADLRPLWAPNFLVRQATVVARDNERVIVFVHQDDTPHRRSVMPWVAGTDVREFPTGVANYGAPGDALRPLTGALDELGVSPSATVATDIGTVASIDNLHRALGSRSLVDATGCMRDARSVKSKDELQIMRFASAASDLAMERAIASIEPGIRECEVLAVAMDVFYRLGAEVPQCNLIVCSGPNTMPMQRYAGDRAIQENDLVMLDLGACFDGMFSELARTVVCGEANDRQRAIFRTAREIHEATIEALEPGRSYASVRDAAASAYVGSEFAGTMQRMVICHGIGVGYAEAPFIPPPGPLPVANTILEPGVTLAVVPTLLVPDVPGGGGVRIEDVIAVTEHGPERLTVSAYDPALG